MTLHEILNRYKVVLRKESYLILKLRDKKDTLSSTTIMKETYKWDQWINIPKIIENKNTSFLQAKTHFKRSLLQKIKKIVYKECEVYIHYKFIDGTQKQYRIVLDNAKNGLWITPFLSSLFKIDLLKDVVSIKFTHNKYDYFEDDFTIEWVLNTSKESLFEQLQLNNIAYMVNIDKKLVVKNIKFNIDEFIDTSLFVKIRGWAYKQNKLVDYSTKYIVLKNTEHEYTFSVTKQERKDVTKYFKAKNLDQSGFITIIKKDELPEGSYDLYILLKNKNGITEMIDIRKKVIIKKR